MQPVLVTNRLEKLQTFIFLSMYPFKNGFANPPEKGDEKAIDYFFLNDESRQPMGNAACSVDEIEAIAGYDFFRQLPDKLGNRIEASNKLGKWH